MPFIAPTCLVSWWMRNKKNLCVHSSIDKTGVSEGRLTQANSVNPESGNLPVINKPAFTSSRTERQRISFWGLPWADCSVKSRADKPVCSACSLQIIMHLVWYLRVSSSFLTCQICKCQWKSRAVQFVHLDYLLILNCNCHFLVRCLFDRWQLKELLVLFTSCSFLFAHWLMITQGPQKHVFISAHLNIFTVVTNSMDNVLSQCLYVILCYHVVINCDLDHFLKTLLHAIKNMNS